MTDASDGMTSAATGMTNAAAGINSAAEGINKAATTISGTADTPGASNYIDQAAGIMTQVSNGLSTELPAAVQQVGDQFSTVSQQISTILSGYGETTGERL